MQERPLRAAPKSGVARSQKIINRERPEGRVSGENAAPGKEHGPKNPKIKRRRKRGKDKEAAKGNNKKRKAGTPTVNTKKMRHG